ncbi:MAG: peptidyl-prolyl cis-trans isomerase [Gemmatimonadaceae bacterium]|nr:peptidyl-prolyl cis-trans isomerase [Gemmatimonadaceae bacterium]
MLQQMRSAAKYIWIIIVIAFVGGFLLYETSGLVGQAPVTTTTAVAKVNGTEILYVNWLNAGQSLAQQQEQRLGRGLTLDERQQVDEQAYQQLVDDILLRQEYEKRGIRVTDAEIVEAAQYSPPPQFQSAPELQTDGRFDPAKYRRFLQSPAARTNGLLAQLEGFYRTEIPRQKLFQQVTADVYISDARLWSVWQDTHDSAQVSYLAWRASEKRLEGEKAVSDAEIAAYYAAHPKAFDRPGTAVVSLVTIPRTPLASDSAAALTKARALRDEIVKGAKFDDVAKRESADTVSGRDGGALGRGGKGRFVKAFEDAAYKLAVNEVSQPVLTDFGYHIIKVTEKKGDTLDLRHLLVRIQQVDSSAAATDKQADRLASLASAAEEPAKFDSAAKELKLLVSQIPVREGESARWLNRPIPSVSSWAFTGAKIGESSDLFDDEQAYYLVRLDSLTPGGKQPLERVKDEIRSRLAVDKALDLLLPEAAKIAKSASTGGLESVVAAAGRGVEKTGMFVRTGYTSGLTAMSEAIGAAFTLPVGAVSAPIRTRDAIYVLRVDKRVAADRAAWETQKSQQRSTLLQGLREAKMRGFLSGLRETAKIDDRRKAVLASQRRTAL